MFTRSISYTHQKLSPIQLSKSIYTVRVRRPWFILPASGIYHECQCSIRSSIKPVSIIFQYYFYYMCIIETNTNRDHERHHRLPSDQPEIVQNDLTVLVSDPVFYAIIVCTLNVLLSNLPFGFPHSFLLSSSISCDYSLQPRIFLL